MNGPVIAEKSACEHQFASEHIPGHLIYWVRQCQFCHAVDWDDLDKEVHQARSRSQLRRITATEDGIQIEVRDG